MPVNFKKFGLVAGALFVCWLVVCKVVEPTTSSRDITVLKLADNEVSEWTLDADGYKYFTNTDQCRAAINGQADNYGRYLVSGFMQDMSKGSTGKTLRYTVIDCGSAEDATSLFNEILTIEVTGTKTQAGSYDLTTAAIDADKLAGCKAYVHFGQYYAEITPDGYSPKTDAVSAAVNFIEILKGKIDKI